MLAGQYQKEISSRDKQNERLDLKLVSTGMPELDCKAVKNIHYPMMYSKRCCNTSCFSSIFQDIVVNCMYMQPRSDCFVANIFMYMQQMSVSFVLSIAKTFMYKQPKKDHILLLPKLVCPCNQFNIGYLLQKAGTPSFTTKTLYLQFADWTCVFSYVFLSYITITLLLLTCLL